ncbi:linear amide C-N hydrolase [Salmonella enterica]|uniref:Linear amide C-N hydrolase n=1 Tax=Salmonella enterica TaxID=28901 RepID=A0A628V6Q6_SALER|nr:linear amide C-N hydrolase [Salmonella enterica]EDF5515187.1 linear amide C-N hydrolase [Salmonella enterica]EEC6701471.1 linear amide C-N hydrolase [Salmonella enterica]ELF5201530.1 linear amide C-N hydrolase [Salmonella enterica]
MKINKLMCVMLPALFSFSMASEACTTLAISDSQGDIFHGRTLEYMQDLPSWLTYYPAGTTFTKNTPEGKPGLHYSSRYAVLAITSPITDGDSRDVLEGMNTAGLSFSENMILNAELAPVPSAEDKKALPVTSLGEWALAQFSSVDEVKNAIKENLFWSPVLKHFGNLKSPFHYAFYDKKGGSIVVEVTEGKLHVYDNPTRVMTNGPEFPWHLTNLNNYTHLTNEDRSSGTLGHIRVTQPDSGIAIAALPSSDTSVDRFVRGVYYTTWAEQATSSREAVNTLAHIMSRFDRPKNITTDTLGSEGEGNGAGKPVSEYTVWTTLSDLSRGDIYIRGYNDINYTKYSFSQFDGVKKPTFKKINVAE